MKVYHCDVCERQVGFNDSINGQKELTLELGEAGSKVCLLMEVTTLRRRIERNDPVLCVDCLVKRLVEWKNNRY